MSLGAASSAGARSKPHARMGRNARVSSLALVILLSTACAEPAQRTQLRVLIDADSAVRAVVDNVTATVDYQDAKGGGWRSAGAPRRFEPKAEHMWPLEFLLDPSDVRTGTTYQLTATARDGRMAVVAQARAILSIGSGQR